MRELKVFSLAILVLMASSFASSLQKSLTECSNLAADFQLPLIDVQNDQECYKGGRFIYSAGQCVAYARCRSGFQGAIGGEASGWPINQTDAQKIQPGDVIVYTHLASSGHVAYVESVDPPINGVIKSIWVTEQNYSSKPYSINYPKLYKYCAVSAAYGKVSRRHITNLNEFDRIYHPGGSAASATPGASGKLPALRSSSGQNSSLKAGEATQILGENFVSGSRVVLLQQAPGEPEFILANLHADDKGNIQWNYTSTCNSKTGSYVIRALDQPVSPAAAPGTKSNSITISINGRGSNCSAIPGINTAHAADQSGASTQTANGAGTGPTLDSVTPGNHAPGQFGIDLYGSGFQQGAKVVAQGTDWNSDKAAVTFLAPNHLKAIIVASNPGQFAITVRNPDGQVSASRPFEITASATAFTKSTPTPTPQKGQMSNNSNSGTTPGSPGANGMGAEPQTSGLNDPGKANSTAGPSTSSQGGLHSPLSNSAGHSASPNPSTSNVLNTQSNGQGSNPPVQKPPTSGPSSQGYNPGITNAVPRVNIPPSTSHGVEQTNSSRPNPQPKPLVTGGPQPTTNQPRNSGQTPATSPHTQTVSGQMPPTAGPVHADPIHHDVPRTQMPPQNNSPAPVIHPPAPVPSTPNRPSTTQNTQLPRGPSPTTNMPPAAPQKPVSPPPKPVPPSPQPSAQQKPSPPPAQSPTPSQNNNKRNHETTEKPGSF